MLLAGDIGGTKTEVAIFAPESGPSKPLVSARFASGDYASLEAIVREFRQQAPQPIEAACFDVAGPVRGGRARITNLPWVVETEALRQAFGLKAVWLLNDLEAVAHGVLRAAPEAKITLHAGEVEPGGSIAVIAPGTGLGEAYLTWDGRAYRAHPSEGGHTGFAPIGPLQVGLLDYMSKRWSHVSVERVCSGMALPGLYDYLRDTSYAPETPAVAARLAAAEDRAPIIAAAALAEPPECALCAATIDLFIDILGAETGDLALKVLATGGVYLAGGVPGHLRAVLPNGRFERAYTHKGRLSEVVARMPVTLVLGSIALLGAAGYGLDQMQELAVSA
ncbi:MAG: glucokinase [Anaerolineales bacterium]|nr:glucokinase [Anaerolineales bacterium]